MRRAKNAAFLTLILSCLVAAFFFAPKLVKDKSFPQTSNGEVKRNFFNTPNFSHLQISDKLEKDFIRVCIWNVKNYSLSFRDRLMRPKPEIEKAGICEIIKQISPDVLMLQEVGGDEFLLDLAQRLAEEGEVFEYRLMQASELNSRLGILSKIPPKKVFDLNKVYFKYRDEEKRRSPRATLGMQFETNGIEWVAFTIHLKSKYGAKKDDFEFYEYRRAEIAAILKTISFIDAENFPAIIGGDFNEDPNPKSEAIFAKNNFFILENQGKTPYTYHWRKESRDSIYDYFYVSKNMKNFVLRNGASVFSSLDITKKNAASDHRPVWVDLNFKKN